MIGVVALCLAAIVSWYVSRRILSWDEIPHWWRLFYQAGGVLLAAFGAAFGAVGVGLLGTVPAAILTFSLWRIAAAFLWRRHQWDETLGHEMMRQAWVSLDQKPELKAALGRNPLLGWAMGKANREALSLRGEPSPEVIKEARFRIRSWWLGPALGIPGTLVIVLVMADVLPSVFATAAIVVMVALWYGARFLHNRG